MATGGRALVLLQQGVPNTSGSGVIPTVLQHMYQLLRLGRRHLGWTAEGMTSAAGELLIPEGFQMPSVSRPIPTLRAGGGESRGPSEPTCPGEPGGPRSPGRPDGRRKQSDRFRAQRAPSRARARATVFPSTSSA